MTERRQGKGSWKVVDVRAEDANGLSFTIPLGANKPNGERALPLELPVLGNIIRATLAGAGVELVEPLELARITTVHDYQGNVVGQQVVDAAHPQGEWMPAAAPQS